MPSAMISIRPPMPQRKHQQRPPNLRWLAQPVPIASDRHSPRLHPPARRRSIRPKCGQRPARLPFGAGRRGQHRRKDDGLPNGPPPPVCIRLRFSTPIHICIFPCSNFRSMSSKASTTRDCVTHMTDGLYRPTAASERRQWAPKAERSPCFYLKCKIIEFGKDVGSVVAGARILYRRI